MHEEGEKERFRTLTKGLRLGLGQNLEWEKVFGEKRRFVSREERGIEIFDFKQNQVGPQIYIYRNNSIDQEGIKHLLRIKSR